jgi:hypothetical protein
MLPWSLREVGFAEMGVNACVCRIRHTHALKLGGSEIVRNESVNG